MHARSTHVSRLAAALGLVGLLTSPLAAEPPTPAAPPAPPEATTPPPAPKELGTPEEVWTGLVKEADDPAKRSQGVLPQGAKAYLEAYEKSGRQPAGKDCYYLAQMLQTGRRFEEAAQRFAQAADSAEVAEGLRLSSAVQWTSVQRILSREGKLSTAQATESLARLDGWMPLAKGSSRGQLLWARADLLAKLERVDEALTAFAEAGEASPDLAATLGDQAVELVLPLCDDLASVAACRARVAPVLGRLVAASKDASAQATQSVKALATRPEADRERRQAEQRLKRAESVATQLATIDTPLKLLGEQAQAWTLVKAYGKGQHLTDYKGKVVVLDFWATWCPWCIKSFPALRDLLKAYEGKDLVVVGVTASANNVFDQRYDLDDDMKAKAGPGQVKPVLQRAKAPPPLAAGADDAAKAKHAEAQAAYEKAQAEFPAREQEIIAKFIANHAMTWDVVQIDPKEPGPKYALGGWPHCVVIDREGRVRHFKSGALLREKPEGVAKFRAVLDKLLAEPAATK
jgi:thiol-disulfide isomerase/thioredoxin